MKIKIFLITVLFAGIFNAAFQDNWSTINWREAFQQESGRLDALLQQDKKAIARLMKYDFLRDAVEGLCPEFTKNIDRAAIEQALNNLTPAAKNKLLFIAAKYNLLFIAQCLINNGVDVNTKDSVFKATPLITAVIYGHNEVIKLLLASGADTTIANNYGYIAADYVKTDEIRQLINDYKPMGSADE